MCRAYGTIKCVVPMALRLVGCGATNGLKSVCKKCVEPTALGSKIIR